MQNHYNEKAKKTYNQTQTRIYVKHRKKHINNDIAKFITIGLIMAGCIYGVAKVESGAFDRKTNLDEEQLEYIRNMNNPIVEKEDINNAERKYIENLYSIEKIDELNKKVINDYKNLKTYIIENEIEDFVELDEMNNDKIIEVIYERGTFEKELQDPKTFSESERKMQASYLYELRENILNRQINEIKSNQQKYKNTDSEYLNLEEKINSIYIELNQMNTGSKTLKTEFLNDSFRR